eukprot:jgi/Galph1/5842/GphlegSOOS_G4523.1
MAELSVPTNNLETDKKEEGNADEKDIYTNLEEAAASNSECVRVVIRVRPLNAREQNTNLCVEVGDGGRNIMVNEQGNMRKFTFDSIFSIDGKQQDVFRNVAKPIIDSCLNGYNGTIFAYGQTGSGKTFTMQGPEESIHSQSGEVREMRGIMPRKEEKGDMVEYTVKCAYLQVYNEAITDLLVPSKHNLNIREDTLKGVYVEDLTEETVRHPEDCYQVLRKGVANRTVSATAMNQESSRSHGVFTLIIERKEEKPDNLVAKRVSRLNLVDLAGSERQKLTKTSGQTLKEASNINRSLSVLGYVIMALVDASNGKERHINYRDSKLTFLLKDSLGGNAKTCMVATVSPSEMNVGESVSTLKFAQRAKYIRNKAYVNEETTGSVIQLQAEITRFYSSLLSERENIAKPQDTERDELPPEIKEDEAKSVLDEDERSTHGYHSRNSSSMVNSMDDAEELQKLLACAEQREREVADEKRYLEALFADSQKENKKRRNHLELLETTCKKLMQSITPLVSELCNGEVYDTNERPTPPLLGNDIETEEQTVKDLCQAIEKITEKIQYKQEEMKQLNRNNEKDESSRMQQNEKEPLTKDNNNGFLDIQGESPVLAKLRKKIGESQGSSTFVKKDLVDESQLDYRELAQVEFLRERLAELLQVEAKKDATIQRLNADKATLQKTVEKLKAEINFLTEELQSEKENALLLREQFTERERQNDQPKDLTETEEKIQQLQAKVRSLQTYRGQLQRLVDQQSEEIKSLRMRAQDAWDELIRARLDFESQQRLSIDRLEKLFSEMVKHQRQEATINEKKAAALVIKEQMKQNLQNSSSGTGDNGVLPPLEPLVDRAIEYLVNQASVVRVKNS